MQPPRRSRWFFPWVPLGAAAVAVAVVVGLFFLPSGSPLSPEARGAGLSPDATAAFQTTDKLVLAFNLPRDLPQADTLHVELVGPDGKAVASAEQAVKAGAPRVELKTPKQPAEQLTLRCRLGKESFEVPLSKVLLVKAHETSLSAGQELFAGSTAAMRVDVHGVKSLAETVPLDATVDVQLIEKDGQAHSLYSGKAGQARLAVPKVKAGAYKMRVTTKSALGEEKLERDVTVKAAPKVLLVTDKPLYQPGQVIHIRALALEGLDLAPVAGSAITFEVEDAKGNKVFKKELTTSEYGVAAVDFQLATEVNQGDYRIKALLGKDVSEKTVGVKPYQLPKFKAELTADKKFYLPKEKIDASLQADYFFGKPVAGAKVVVEASTFDVEFKKFATWQGKTDDKGHVKFDVQLPASFVGQPLAKGNALVRLEAKITDGADHTETISRSYPVSQDPVQVSLIPEGGRLVPGLENRVFVAAIYPDGTPAVCDVDVWLGQKADGKPFATVKTAATGLAEVRFTPKQESFRQTGEWQQRNVEMLGGRTVAVGAMKSVFDVTATAQDKQGSKATATVALGSEPFGENVILRLDRAVYKGGESMQIDVRTSAGLPTVYLDVVRSGQTMLTTWLDVKDGQAKTKLDLPPSVFGTVEVHAYQVLRSSEIVRDSRVVYVNAPSELKIDVQADKKEYRPGEEGKIRFTVTDAQGKPTAAALGVLVVDEAVYALQDMQPGLEKVYFTLQEELLKPQVLSYKAAQPIDTLVLQPALAAEQQQAAEVLLTAVRPKAPARWDVEPALERRQRAEAQVAQIGHGLYQYALQHDFLVYDKQAKAWRFKDRLLQDMAKQYGWGADALLDPVGGKLTLEGLAKIEPGLTPDRLARAVTQARIQNLYWAFVNHTQGKMGQWYDAKTDTWTFPDGALADAIKNVPEKWRKDAWGNDFRLVKLDKPQNSPTGHTQFRRHDIVSVGPDGKLDTADDVRLTAAEWNVLAWWWLEGASRQMLVQQQQGRHFGRRGDMLWEVEQAQRFRGMDRAEAKGAGGPNMPLPPGIPGQGGGPRDLAKDAPAKADGKPAPTGDKGGAGEAGGAPPVKVRDYFPETLHWEPALIAGPDGKAEMRLPFADSITTWRLTASASSKGGLLGGVNAPLRVFQPFFVDVDLPLTLTQNDEVAFPVAVYNYLKEDQTVTLTLEQDPSFELTDGLPLTREVSLKSGEVGNVKYRIRAKQLGTLSVTVKAKAGQTEDAVKRSVEVVPNGRKREQVVTDRLNGDVKQALTIPGDAVPGAGKLFVKVYPGVFSQVLEGLDGMLRMPGGCFEQTSSSAYPNILVVDYLRRTKQGNPATMMKAETFLNAGYQRLLTFEHKAGGFDWWGREENPPLIWLSAYGLHEFHDMSKVMPIDRGVIERTQRWLISQQDKAKGTWSNIGATHGESIERMGDKELLLTSYVTWALLESGYKGAEVKKAIDFIRERVKAEESPYILALAANALACWDAKDDSTHEVLKKTLQKLDAKKQPAKAEWKDAACFPIKGGQSLSYARGDFLTTETTALVVLAMMKNGQFAPSVNQCLTYLIKVKQGDGTWGSTQATILALKALLAGAGGGGPMKGEAEFVITCNGKEAGKGKVNEANSDVMQQFDLTPLMNQAGGNEVCIAVKGETSLMYQVVSRHFEPWANQPEAKPTFDVKVAYNRDKLSTADLLLAKATLKNVSDVPMAMVMLDVPVPPGFTVDAGEFAEMVAAKKVNRFSVTARQVILYLGDVKPGQELTFEYTLKPKYPIKAKSPAAVAYEYYTPANKGASAPVELVVEEKK
jgi:uncharacterized protein YfaS (alpha-2-macroglobulin family)